MGYEASFIESFYMMKIGLLFVVLTTFSVARGINEGENQNATRFRGTMINPNLNEEDFRVLRSWNANHIRWQLAWFGDAPEDKANISQYEVWLESALKQFDSMLPVLRELGLNVLLDLHTKPGGFDQQHHCRLFNEKQFQDYFLTVWEMMANRYKNESLIMGYDILNEPDDSILAPGLLSWRDLAIATVQHIRAIDSQHSIIVEASPGSVSNTLPNFEPLPFDNIIYSFHMYEPYDFTYQNLNFNVTPIYYPGAIRNTTWNKEQLRTLLQPNADWQKRYNVSIHVGEFSAIRWAPGNSTCNYLSDLIELYEEYGWTWDYHAFREFQGWDVEMIGDKDHPQLSPVPTDRQLLLLEWFKNNKH
jgi:aryl-phospho-beta-D-glucosidase BglC (GH1 family)